MSRSSSGCLGHDDEQARAPLSRFPRGVVAIAVTLAAAGCGGNEASPRRESDVESQIKEKLAENREALPNDESSEAAVPNRSVEEFVRLYRPLGFFDERAEHVVQRLVRAYRRDWGEDPSIRTRSDELALLAYDSHRVWFQDVERDVLERRGWVFAAPDEVRLAFGYGQLHEGGQAARCE